MKAQFDTAEKLALCFALGLMVILLGSNVSAYGNYTGFNFSIKDVDDSISQFAFNGTQFYVNYFNGDSGEPSQCSGSFGPCNGFARYTSNGTLIIDINDSQPFSPIFFLGNNRLWGLTGTSVSPVAREYNITDNSTIQNFSVSSGISSQRTFTLTHNQTSIFAVHSKVTTSPFFNRIVEYNLSGSSTGFEFNISVPSFSILTGSAISGKYLYGIQSSQGAYIIEYNLSGSSTGFQINISNQMPSTSSGLLNYINNKFYFASTTNAGDRTIFQYTKLGIYGHNATNNQIKCDADTMQAGLTNISIWTNVTGNFTMNQSQTRTGVVNSSNFTLVNFPRGSYTYACQACDGDGICDFSLQNYTFSRTGPIVNLTSPLNNTFGFSSKDFTCQADNLVNMTNATLFVWNSTNVLINQTTRPLTGVSNQTTFNISFATADAYKWNCQVTDSELLSNFFSSNYTINMETNTSVTTLNYPVSNSWISNGTNIPFNCTTQGSNLGSEFFYGNFTGTFGLNQTRTPIVSNVPNIFNLTLADGSYLWTCGANKTTNSTIVLSQYGNATVNIDSVLPNVTISSVATTQGSVIITASSTQSDLRLQSCKYAIYDTNGDVNGNNNNVTFTCNQNIVASVTAIGTYNLSVVASDFINEGSAMVQFTISAVPAPAGGGGAVIPPQEIEEETLSPNLESNLFGFLSQSAFVWGDFNVTYFTLGIGAIGIIIAIYSYTRGRRISR